MTGDKVISGPTLVERDCQGYCKGTFVVPFNSHRRYCDDCTKQRLQLSRGRGKKGAKEKPEGVA